MTAATPRPGITTRRALLAGGLGATGVGAVALTSRWSGDQSGAQTRLEGAVTGGSVVPFHGTHQSGVTTLPAQAHATFVSLDLTPGQGPAEVTRLMRLLTDDAARLTAGAPPLGADDRELTALPSRLTVTFGFGGGLFDAVGRGSECPEVIRTVPKFATDRLEPRWSGGDLLVQVCSEDPLRLAYAVRRLVRDARTFTRVRWVQRGFTQAPTSEPPGTTPRNLMGQRDGTANLPAGPDLDEVVWAREGPQWMVGGSMLVLRRIRMDIETWDDFGRAGKELATARHLTDGSPLTGGTEHDRPDPEVTDSLGLPVVDPSAHVMRATARRPTERMLRRGYSFDDGPRADGTADSGLIFAAFQADAAAAFVPVQARLAELDALNLWTTHIGSAAFVIPPGCAPDEFIGHQLLVG